MDCENCRIQAKIFIFHDVATGANCDRAQIQKISGHLGKVDFCARQVTFHALLCK